MRLLTLLLLLSITAFGQQIPGSRIVNESIGPEKFTPAALRPISSGTLSSGVLTFDEPKEVFTKTVDADLALSLAGSGHVAYSQIILELTGDGVHVVTWPTSWEITGTYNPEATQSLTLDYNGTTIIGKFTGSVDISEVTLVEGVVDSGTPDIVTLTFDAAVIITSDGWSLEADGVAVDLIGVTGSGTTTPAVNLVRDIIGDEVLTLSYNPATGATTSLTGNELETITDAAVTGFSSTPPVGDFDLYVDDDAVDDVAAGTIGDPYKTIQAASDASIAGQKIGIRSGTYRETIVGKTGVIYEGYPGETAVVNGMTVMSTSGFTVHSGSIYKKTITLPVNGYNTSTSLISESVLNTTIFANQILRNGVMLIEARWPNITIAGTYGTDDYLLRSKYRENVNWTNGFGVTSLTDAGIPFNTSTSNLVGATLVASGWISQEPRTVLTHPSNTTVTYSAIWGAGGTNDWHRARYYLTNKLFMLDMAGEWHYENGTFYIWQPGGGTPTGTIEYKTRNWGFDLRDKQNVTIKGLTFIGCDAAHGNTNTSGVTIDGIVSRFASHHVRHDVILWQGVGMARQFGIKLKGANNTVKNSDIGYSGSQGIWIGPGGRIENNFIHDLGYVGYWANGAGPWDNIETGGLKFLHNTTSNTGRSGFDFGYHFHYGDQAGSPQRSRKFDFEIAYNDFSGWGSICQDVGPTYAWGQNDLKNLDYHHNYAHDTHAPDGQFVGANVGLYFDQSTGPGRIHHNIIETSGCCDFYHETWNGTRPFAAGSTWLRPNAQMDVYNNTFANAGGVSPRSYVTYRAAPFDRFRNNIFISTFVSDAGNDRANSVLPGTNPLFTGTGTGIERFQLQSGSPARGIGINNYVGLTQTITDAHTDAGAIPFGATPHTVGWNPVVDEDDDETVNDNDTEITYSASNWTYYANFKPSFVNGDAHVTSAVNATAEYIFTGTEVSVIAEKCDNMGIVRFEIFDDTSVNGTFNVQIGSDVDVDMYVNTGGTAQNWCPNGQRGVVFTVDGLTAGDKMVKMTLLTIDNTAVPARNTYVLDQIQVVP